MTPNPSRTSEKKEEKVKAVRLNSEKNYRYRGTTRVPNLFTWPSQCIRKHVVVKRILVRWNYCMKWPDDATTPKSKLERREELRKDKKVLEMKGFPGLFVYVHGSEIGKLIDTRDLSKAPTANNLLKMNCLQLKELWMTALREQIKVLTQEEGKDAISLPCLEYELKAARAFDGEAAEREFKAYSKAPFMWCVY